MTVCNGTPASPFATSMAWVCSPSPLGKDLPASLSLSWARSFVSSLLASASLTRSWAASSEDVLAPTAPAAAAAPGPAADFSGRGAAAAGPSEYEGGWVAVAGAG